MNSRNKEARRHGARWGGPGITVARALTFTAALVVGAGPSASQAPEPTAQPENAVVALLQGLDKTTARVSTFQAPIGAVARFGTLEIVSRACHKKPPTETPESAAFLEIVDVRPDSPAVNVFSGWMFASSPALSALEHPVYDVWVIDCRRPGEGVETAASPADAPFLGSETLAPADEPAGEGVPED